MSLSCRRHSSIYYLGPWEQCQNLCQLIRWQCHFVCWAICEHAVQVVEVVTDALLWVSYQPCTLWHYIDDIFMIWAHSVEASWYGHILWKPFMLSPLTWTGSTPPLSLYPIIHLHSSYQKSYSIQLNSSIASHLFLWLWNNIPMNSNLTLTKEDIIYLSLIKKYHTFTTPQVFKHLSPKTPPLLISQWVLLLVTYNGALCYVSSVNHKHFNILTSSPCGTNVLNAKAFVAFQPCNNRSNLSVSAKLHKPATIANQPCPLSVVAMTAYPCSHINNRLTKYTCHSTSKTRFINHHSACNS